jgi:hypothetical protein
LLDGADGWFAEAISELPKGTKLPSGLMADGKQGKAVKYHDDFNKLVGERDKIRRYACGVIAEEPSCGSFDTPILSIEAARSLRQGTDVLHVKLLADYDRPLEELMMLPDYFKPKIVEIQMFDA